MARLRTISRNLQCDLRGSCAVKLQEVLIGFVNKDSPGFVGWKGRCVIKTQMAPSENTAWLPNLELSAKYSRLPIEGAL
jgi:hypothetical protein